MFTYTHKDTDFNSSAVESAYYNEENQELVVVLTGGNAYLYSGVPLSIWDGFTGSWSAGSYYVSHIKRDYGPSENLGYCANSYFEKAHVPAADMGPVLDGDATISGANFVGATTGINTAVLNWQPNRKHTVRFNSGISDREYVVETTGVDAAVADLMRLAEMLGIRDQIKVKEVVTHFE